MDIGLMQIMQKWGYDGMTDGEVYDEELKLVMAADEHGFDSTWVVEHHFEDYSFCPDNFVYLAYLAAKTKQIKLATGAVIVPWNTQPLRIAEKAALLDQISGGRAILGLGRGLSRREFNQFGVDMDESRERFDEAVPMILQALETGVMEEHHGKYFDQPRAVIRPHPKSFDGRVAQIAMSPDSGQEAAKHGARLMAFNYIPVEQQKTEYEAYAKTYRENHNKDPEPMVLSEVMVCDTDASRCEDNARKYIGGYMLSVMHHYELMGEHFKDAQGYEAYGDAVDALNAAGLESATDTYVSQQVWGTPQQMLDKLEKRRSYLGDAGLLCIFRCAGIPFEAAKRSMDTFAKEVMPELRTWSSDSKTEAA